MKKRSCVSYTTALLATLIVGLSSRVLSVELEDETLVAQLMTDQYGGRHIPTHGCWLPADPELDGYCVRPVKAKRIQVRTGARLYVLTEGLPANADGQLHDWSSHVASGLVGAFVAALDDRNIASYIAVEKNLRFGTWGRAFGIESARLLELGPSGNFGWVFSTGGTWQGITAASYNILARDGTTVIDVSEIPLITEGDQDHTYDIAVDSSWTGGAFYPLVVTKRVGDQGPKVECFVVHFDTSTWRYKMPDGERKACRSDQEALPGIRSMR